MKTIYKYELKITDYQEVVMPFESVILSCGFQNGTLCLWAQVVPKDTVKISRRILIFGTGTPIEGELRYHKRFIDTAQHNGYVWHIFEKL